MGINPQSVTEQMYQALFEEAADGIFISDTQGHFLEVNRQGCDLLGYSREELVQLSWQEVFPAGDGRKGLPGLEDASEGQIVRIESQVRGKEGHMFTAEIKARRLADGRLVAFVRDINAHKRTEVIQHNYELLASQSRDIILIMRQNDGRILEANVAAVNSYGYSREELLALTIHDLRAPETRTLTVAQMAEAKAQGLLFETVHRRKDGSTFPVEVSSQGTIIHGTPTLISIIRDITSRKQSEEALRQSEARFSTIFSASPIGICITRLADGQLIDANPAFLRMFDYRREEVIGSTTLELRMWASSEERDRAMEILREHGRISNLELKFRRKSGEMGDLLMEAEPIDLADGPYLLSLVQDISERKRTEAEVEEMAKFPNENPNPVMRISQDGSLLYANQASRELLKSWNYTLNQSLPDYWSKLIRETLETGLSREKEVAFGARVFSLVFTPIVADGYVNIYGYDITERKQAEAAQQVSEARLAGIIGSAIDAIITVDEEQRIVLFNAAAEKIFGYTASEMLGQPLNRLLPERFHEAHDEHMRAFERSGASTQAMGHSGDIIGRRANGEEFPLEVSISQIEVAGAKLYTAIHRDITERKQAEEAQAKLEGQLRQAQKMESVGRLAGGVAHDFNNLLTVINGYSNLLLSKISSDSPMFEPLEQIRRAGERAAKLTRQLLAFSRKQMLTPTLLDLNDLVTNLNEMLGRLIGEDIRLGLVLQPGLWPVTADPGQIEQVIMNLAVNARDAMPTGGMLTLETGNVQLDDTYAKSHPEAPVGPCVMLAVTDTGLGMDGPTKARIFEPFFTTKEVGQGTGLGLATVYGIVKQSGGDILVYSEPGQGTTFKIYLPARKTTTHEWVAPQTEPAIQGGHETILLVEDEEMVRALVRSALQDKGYTILEAHEGYEALSLFRQHPGPIDLLLTDVVMPRMSGRELAEQLKALHPELKVLFMSGYTDDAVVRHGLLTAEVEFLPKPFSPSRLAAKIREMLDE